MHTAACTTAAATTAVASRGRRERRLILLFRWLLTKHVNEYRQDCSTVHCRRVMQMCNNTAAAAATRKEMLRAASSKVGTLELPTCTVLFTGGTEETHTAEISYSTK